ncbi:MULTISPECIES: hypothetical protein [Dehalobacter]|uniref:hypothetical protein n=1 Tax=Dehalobacter TaxID=56112 RepID=UPI00258FB7B1|nr:hypothetical protein [Dehalobacter sp.]MDJ0306692.1 hypothetical protein [Dehalobacter sp.]
MWERIRRELLVEYYWWKRQKLNKRRLDSPIGLLGILLITVGIILMVIIGQGIGALFRNMIPFVSGTQVAGTYWSSVFLALKISLLLIVMMIGFAGIIIYKLFKRKK